MLSKKASTAGRQNHSTSTPSSKKKSAPESVRDVELRPKARADLDGIWNYSVQTWGVEQAERYIRAINTTFETLAEKPELGRLYKDVYENLRVYPSGSHLIFYFASEKSIDIVCVLHKSTDIQSHL